MTRSVVVYGEFDDLVQVDGDETAWDSFLLNRATGKSGEPELPRPLRSCDHRRGHRMGSWRGLPATD
jgi:hypothetical protein